jgi:cytochrome c556
MQRTRIAILVATIAIAASGIVHAHKGKEDMPPGPIHDRHELMEGIGKNAKTIGDAMKTGNMAAIPSAAKQIQTDAAKVLALFPKGSTHPSSRAKDEIWVHWDKFEGLTKELETKAGELVTAASSGGDVDAAAKAMFGTCKSCHDQFRKPEEKH